MYANLKILCVLNCKFIVTENILKFNILVNIFLLKLFINFIKYTITGLKNDDFSSFASMGQRGYNKAKRERDDNMQLIFPILPELLLPGDFAQFWGPDAEEIRGSQFSGQKMQALELRGCDVDQCVFSNCRFIQCRLESCRFCDVIFDSCDLSNLQLPNCSFRRTVFKNCKLSGSIFSEAVFRDTAFQHVVAPYTNFLNSKWKNCLLQHSDFSEAFFAEAVFSSLSLEETRLTRSDFSRAKLDKADYRSCDIRDVRWELSQLRGCVISYEQAADLARAAGISVQ